MALYRPAALSLLLVSVTWAVEWADAAKRLARQTAEAAGPREAVTLQFENRSSASAAEAGVARKALEAELRRAGLRLVSSAETQVRATLAENVREYVWTVETRKGESESVALEAMPRPVRPSGAIQRRIILEAVLLASQSEPILDVSAVAGDRFLVLTASRLLLRSREVGAEPLASVKLEIPVTLSRDPRGRLEIAGDHWTARFPGAVCTVTLDALSANCRASDEPWLTAAGPARMLAHRNYFEGPPPFYAAAAWKGNVIRTGLDRQTLVGSQTFPGWGSDIASIESACGAGEQVLVTLPGGPVEPDGVQAYEFAGREPVAVSSVVEMPGPITALWSSGARATAVAFNLKTTSYEAYSLAVRCSH